MEIKVINGDDLELAEYLLEKDGEKIKSNFDTLESLLNSAKYKAIKEFYTSFEELIKQYKKLFHSPKDVDFFKDLAQSVAQDVTQLMIEDFMDLIENADSLTDEGKPIIFKEKMKG